MTTSPRIAPASLRPTAEQLARFRLARGFASAAAACGLKPSGRADLALVSAERACSAAGLFTTNRVQAAPVVLDRERLAAAADRVRAVIANAGCANAVTGPRGLEDARRTAALVASRLGARDDEVLVLSTGVIGVPLDMDKIARGIAALAGPDASHDAASAAAAITTTDTCSKIAAEDVRLPAGVVELRGFAKGAGMIHPDMATMLAVITTDVAAPPAALDRALRAAADASFHAITVDGDTSTNDTVLLLASGASGVTLDQGSTAAFGAALERVCVALAKQIARDGEGATRLIEIAVSGAANAGQARRVGRTIAGSALVRTAIHGGDPNWGRILAAAGRSGEPIDPARVGLWFGDGDALQLLERGMPLPFDRAAAAALLRGDPVRVRIDLGLGDAAAVGWTCDLSADYVRINADYTT
ncbi:MAG TPA: bifunctional glutamate N-acetyltransferase/amino-acid acetyltransferase ArgJ [Candidatus Eisenbacteria bacterium]|nr:bifunctional glutamate N-acetyltransferase/amino-acid acetyltransferase ArgJ [Candidatus Eisenbacteria bacterium]